MRRCRCRWLRPVDFKLDGKNLLDSPYRITQGDVIRHEYHTGRVFSVGVTWRPLGAV